MFEYARRRRRMTVNPVGLLEALSVPTQDTPVLREEEVAALLNAYRLAQESATPDDAEWWTLARRLTVFALGTALRRGEILALRWQDVEMARTAPTRPPVARPRPVRRAEEQGGKADDQLRAADRRRAPRAVPGEPLPVAEVARVLHPKLGPLDPSKVSGYMRKAIREAGIERPIRPWHDLRHTALTHDAAAGNPAVYVQARAGHAQATMTERYVHAAQVAFPGAAERSEERFFSSLP